MAKEVVKLSSLKADMAKEREGDWIPADDLGQGIEFLVRSLNYPPFMAARDQASMRLSRKYDNKSAPPEEMALVNGQLAVEHLLLDWRGLDVPFSAQTAAEVLTDDAYRRVRTAVFAAASRVGVQQVEFVAAAEGN